MNYNTVLNKMTEIFLLLTILAQIKEGFSPRNIVLYALYIYLFDIFSKNKTCFILGLIR